MDCYGFSDQGRWRTFRRRAAAAPENHAVSDLIGSQQSTGAQAKASNPA